MLSKIIDIELSIHFTNFKDSFKVVCRIYFLFHLIIKYLKKKRKV